MKIDVKIVYGKVTKKSLEISNGSTYENLLNGLGINPETVVVFRDDVPVPLDDEIVSGKITVLRVVSGG